MAKGGGKPMYKPTNKGAQEVKAPIGQSAGKKGTVKTGGDLRTTKGKK